MASVMMKILCKNMNTSKSAILAKCKTDRQLSRTKTPHESSQDTVLQKATELQSTRVQKDTIKKREWEELGHVKPSVLDRDRERNLQRIATKGVVQLFNAVHKQQSLLDNKLSEAGPSERRREKVVESLTKGRFLDMLKTTKVGKEQAAPAAEVKTEPADDMDTVDDSVSWSILRDDFMMGARMKDWDKQTTDNNDDINTPADSSGDSGRDDDSDDDDDDSGSS